jgi:replicative DNA helicase
MQHEQFAPHSIEAEQAVLGALLLNNRAHEDVSQVVHAAHFYDPLHREIYAAIDAVKAGAIIPH